MSNLQLLQELFLLMSRSVGKVRVLGKRVLELGYQY